jgi:hypothetical protein
MFLASPIYTFENWEREGVDYVAIFNPEHWWSAIQKSRYSKTLIVNWTEVLSVWKLTYLRFIYTPKYGVTRAELHNYILSIIANRE